VALGDAHSCALTDRGEVFCWGKNESGQLGDGTLADRATPVQVRTSVGGPPLVGVKSLSLGEAHTCALMEKDGNVYCWGAGSDGQLGDGLTADRSVPAPVLLALGGGPLQGVQAIGRGNGYGRGLFGCAIVNGGAVLCWGGGVLSPAPPRLASSDNPLSITNVRRVAVGGGDACVVSNDGTVRCWGESYEDFAAVDSIDLPDDEGGGLLSGVVDVTVGAAVGGLACAMLDVGEVRCWGDNKAGELGQGYFSASGVPRPVLTSKDGPPLRGVKAVGAGSLFACVLLETGGVQCWWRPVGATGGTNSASPVPVPADAGGQPLAGVQGLAAGLFHACAWLGGTDVRCWGDNSFGQLGDDTTDGRTTPVRVKLPF
jgi:alpha-tubulin suppressor-like RCC1 family protein